MSCLPEFGNGSENMVLVNQPLYALKRAGRAWNTLLGKIPEEQIFEQCLVDLYIFRLMSDWDVRMNVAIYVNDMIVVRLSRDCEDLQALLSQCLPTKFVGELRR